MTEYHIEVSILLCNGCGKQIVAGRDAYYEEPIMGVPDMKLHFHKNCGKRKPGT